MQEHWICCWFGMCPACCGCNGGRSSDTNAENKNRQR